MLWNRFHQFREVISLLFCVGFSIFSLIWNGNFIARGVASSQRLSNVFSSSLDGFGGFFKSAYTKLQSYESLQKERDSYLKLIEEYKNLPHDMELLRQENIALRKELGFQIKSDYRTLKAEVISVRLNSIYRTIIIDKGSNAGIKPYMPVVAKAIDESGQVIQALVGKVISTTSGTSAIQPIINSGFSAGVQVPGTNIWASLSGNSGRGTQVLLNYIDNGIIISPLLFGGSKIGPASLNDPLVAQSVGSIGKSVYTSPGGGIFPGNIPVGTIVEEGPRSGSFKSAYVKPFVKFEELQYVNIIMKLPDKWVEEWPQEKSIAVENPNFGEVNFPGEDLEKEKKEKEKEKLEKKKTQTQVQPQNVTPIGQSAFPQNKKKEKEKTAPKPKPSELEESEDAMLKKLEGN